MLKEIQRRIQLVNAKYGNGKPTVERLPASVQHYPTEDPANDVVSKEENVNTEEGFDQFLQDATLAVRELWEGRRGLKLDSDDAQNLNTELENFFHQFKQ